MHSPLHPLPPDPPSLPRRSPSRHFPCSASPPAPSARRTPEPRHSDVATRPSRRLPSRISRHRPSLSSPIDQLSSSHMSRPPPNLPPILPTPLAPPRLAIHISFGHIDDRIERAAYLIDGDPIAKISTSRDSLKENDAEIARYNGIE